jgi:hypothetical protein
VVRASTHRNDLSQNAHELSVVASEMEFGIAAAAAACATAVTHPLDTLITQAQAGVQWTPRALYRGFALACAGNALSYGLLIGIYSSWRESGHDLATAAAASACAESVLRGPFDALKVLRQIGVETGKARAVVKGTLATLARELPGNVVYFSTYETLRGPTFLEQAFAGFAAGAAIAAVGFPLDTLRVRWVARQRLCIPLVALWGLPAACLRVGVFNLLFFSCRQQLTAARFNDWLVLRTGVLAPA